MAQLTVAASIDSHMDHCNPDTNYGTEGLVMLSVLYTGEVKSRLCRPIGNFDVSAIPAGATIDEARLVHDVQLAGNGATFLIARCIRAGAWTELGVTWNKWDGVNNWISPGGDYSTTTPPWVPASLPADTGTFESPDVESFVTDAIAYRNNIVSVIYKLLDENPETPQWMYFSAGNQANPWKLVIDYTPLPASFPLVNPETRLVPLVNGGLAT